MPDVSAPSGPTDSPTGEPAGPATLAARAAFPRGLRHPPGGYRSAMDALLLAAFVPLPACRRLAVVELGTGNGAALCALALRAGHIPEFHALGVDVQDDAVAAARANIAALGLEGRCAAHSLDLTDLPALTALAAACHGPHEPAHVVMANPPYHAAGTRTSPHAARALALHEPPPPDATGMPGERGADLPAFCRAAATLLRHTPRKRHGGRFLLVYAASRLPRAVACLHAAGFGLRRVECVFTKAHGPASRVLIEARWHCADDVALTCARPAPNVPGVPDVSKTEA